MYTFQTHCEVSLVLDCTTEGTQCLSLHKFGDNGA